MLEIAEKQRIERCQQIQENFNIQLSDPSSSKSSAISTNDVQRFIDTLKQEKHRIYTKKNYYCVWKIFSDFYL